MAIHPSASVHPSAVIEAGAVVEAGCRIGPFAYVGPEVHLGTDVELKPHAIVTGSTEIGEGGVVFSCAVVGEVPQDLKFSGEESRLKIGPRARIREHATLNTGTAGGGGLTSIGADCLIMAGAHVAHDCRIGDRVILVNNVGLAGHCVVEDDVIIGGLSGVHQFVRIGRGAMIGALSMVAHDVLPFGLVQGPRAKLDGLNLVGLRRRGAPREEIAALRAAYQVLAGESGAFQSRAAALGAETDSSYVAEIVRFVSDASERSFLTPG